MRQSDRFDVLLVGYEDGEENIGIRSIASYLEQHNIKVGIEAYNHSSEEKILRYCNFYEIKIIGFSLIYQGFLFEFRRMMKYLRREGIQSHFTIGGHFPTLAPEETLQLMPELDTVVLHEGEQTLLDLYYNLDKPALWSEIKGIAYRENGKIRMTPKRPLISNLDSLPFMKRYQKAGPHKGLGISSILASRGCYHNCSFCSIQQFYGSAPGPKRRSRSPGNVVDEMEQLFYRYGTRIFMFRDDDIGLKGSAQRAWLESFTKEIMKRNLSEKIFIRIPCRIDEIDYETLNMLKEIGLKYIFLGIESGCNKGLITCNKGYDVDQVRISMKIIRDLKIAFDYGFMMFDPDSTIETIDENINFLRELCEGGQAPVHFGKMFPYVGTTIARRLAEEGRLEGGLINPNYKFKEFKMNLLEYFIFRTFDRYLGPDGLARKLQYAIFTTTIVEHFFEDNSDNPAYIQAISNLIQLNNNSVLNTIKKLEKFVLEVDHEDIYRNWHIFETIYEKEKQRGDSVTKMLDTLVNSYNYTNNPLNIT